jgi:dolichol-phosphate mannosyltransferase
MAPRSGKSEPTHSTGATTTPPAGSVSPRPVVSVVVPTFNEAENLERMVHALISVLAEAGCIPFEILVADDASSDGTDAIADRLALEVGAPHHRQATGKLRVLHRRGPRGLAASVCDGWQMAQGEILAVIDCDFQHPPELLARLVQAVRAGSDIVVASRYAPGGGTTRNWGLGRKLLSSTSTLITRLSIGNLRHSLHDPLSGFFALRREVVEGIRLQPVGFRTLLEVLACGRYRTVSEIPYLFAERKRGDSKMRLRVALDDARQLLRVIRRRFRQNKRQM